MPGTLTSCCCGPPTCLAGNYPTAGYPSLIWINPLRALCPDTWDQPYNQLMYDRYELELDSTGEYLHSTDQFNAWPNGAVIYDPTVDGLGFLPDHGGAMEPGADPGAGVGRCIFDIPDEFFAPLRDPQRIFTCLGFNGGLGADTIEQPWGSDTITSYGARYVRQVGCKVLEQNVYIAGIYNQWYVVEWYLYHFRFQSVGAMSGAGWADDCPSNPGVKYQATLIDAGPDVAIGWVGLWAQPPGTDHQVIFGFPNAIGYPIAPTGYGPGVLAINFGRFMDLQISHQYVLTPMRGPGQYPTYLYDGPLAVTEHGSLINQYTGLPQHTYPHWRISIQVVPSRLLV